MEVKGIRILDGSNIHRPTLSDILEEITDRDSLYWSILFLDGTPNPGQGHFLTEFKNKIIDSKNGISIKWEELKMLSDKFYQMFETTVLACRDKKLLHRYKKEKEMYVTCDIVVELIDCAFWEVYSKDQNLLDKLHKKFQKVETL